MHKYLKLIFIALVLFSIQPAQATSLDGIYRDLIRNDNQGYLPIFVKNRNTPDLLYGDDLEKLATKPEIEETTEKPINLIDERKLREEAKLAAIKKWDDTIKAVKENRVTPIELQEIEKHVAQEEARAIEILAWMNARGVGVKQDLIKAFNLYRKAATMEVPNANKNAALIYRSMTREQRESLSEYKE